MDCHASLRRLNKYLFSIALKIFIKPQFTFNYASATKSEKNLHSLLQSHSSSLIYYALTSFWRHQSHYMCLLILPIIILACNLSFKTRLLFLYFFIIRIYFQDLFIIKFPFNGSYSWMLARYASVVSCYLLT